MADITKDQVKEFLGNLSVIEMAELVKDLEEAWGVSAAAPVAMVAGGLDLGLDALGLFLRDSLFEGERPRIG